jgi:transcriptional regulator with XRE-family HTH domain
MQLSIARRRAGFRTQSEFAKALGASTRTVGNYENDRTHPTPANMDLIHELLGHFEVEDVGGEEKKGDSIDCDPVETAIRASALTTDRQYLVLSAYARQLREQAKEQG